MKPDDARRRLARLRAEYDHADRSVAEERAALKGLKAKIADLKAAQELAQRVAEAVQESAHQQIAAVVTRCLGAVFGEDAYEFRIRFERKRGKTEAKLLFARDGLEVDPLSAAGGGVVDVAAFALRLACLVLSRPRKRLLLILDEPFKHLSKDYRPQVRRLVETLAKEMGVQFIFVSHAPDLATGKVVEF